MEGEDSEFCSISIEPKSGDLGPREQLELALYLTAHKHVSTLSKIHSFHVQNVNIVMMILKFVSIPSKRSTPLTNIDPNTAD